MKWDELTDKDKVRLLLQHVMGCFMLQETATGWRTPHLPERVTWPIAFWNPDGECWMMRDVAHDPLPFDPLCDLNDTWLIIDKIKPGGKKDDPETYSSHANFMSWLDNDMTNWWTYTKERMCSEICKNALKAYGIVE